MRFLFKSRRSGYQYSQGRCNMAESTKRRHCFRYFGNHLDTMFLLIASMVSVTHNRRRISIKVVIVKNYFEKKKNTSSHCFKSQTRLLGRATVPKLYFFLCNLCSCGVPGQYVAFFDEVEEEIGYIEDNGICHASKTIS